MSNKIHKISIRPKSGTKGPMTGANVELLMDGQPFKGVRSLEFKIEAGSTATIKFELVGQVDFEGYVLTEFASK